MLIGRLFAMVPVATVAVRVNWLSALSSALAVLLACRRQALALGLLVYFGTPQVWQIVTLAAFLGSVNAFDGVKINSIAPVAPPTRASGR